MSEPRLRLITEQLPGQQILQVIYAREVEERLIEVEYRQSASGAISVAQTALLNRPDLPVALVLNSHTEDPDKLAELLGSAERILARIAPRNWHVALAIPRLDAWALCDPAVAADYESHATTRNGDGAYSARAARLIELAAQREFRHDLLRAASVQFRRLDDFVRQCLATPPTPQQALAF